MTLKLKEVLAKLLVYTQAYPTITNHTVYDDRQGTDKIVILKRGGVATVKFNGVQLSSVNSRTDFALIPEGFRPITETAGLFDSTVIWFFVRPTGTIAINPTASSSTYWGTVTYLIK